MKNKLQISKRSNNSPFSPIRKLFPIARKIKEQGVEVFQLNIGQPDIETPIAIRRAICLDYKIIPYAPSEGIHKTILAWQKYYMDHGIKVGEDNILVTQGGSEALIFGMALVADPGDEVVVFEPFYANYKTYAKLLGIKLRPVTLKVENGFHFSKESEIASKITKKTKAILACNPSNPTGVILSKREMEIIARLAQKYNLFILSDEVYREFVLNGKPHKSFMEFSEISDRVILLDSISKRFNACGVRIGALVSKNLDVMQNALKFSQARLSVATAEQLGVIPMLLNSKPYTKRLIAEYKKRRDTVYNGLKNIKGAVYKKPEGAFYVITKLPIDSSENFCRWMLEKFRYKNKTLMLAPAADFYATPGLGSDEVRIAYVLNVKKLKEAMKILKRAVIEYKEK